MMKRRKFLIEHILTGNMTIVWTIDWMKKISRIKRKEVIS